MLVEYANKSKVEEREKYVLINNNKPNKWILK